MKPSTLIRLSRSAHQKLLHASRQQNRKITDIIDDLVRDLDSPSESISDQVANMLKELK
jgi:hypothetical protein